MLRAIDRGRYDVVPVGITREGAFVLEEDAPEKFALDASRLPEVVDNGTRILWPEPAGDRRLRVKAPDGEIAVIGEIDAVLPILHGPHGEDGTIQGFFDTIEVPYAGGGVLDSAICMDKQVMKIMLQAAGLAVAPGITVRQASWEADAASVRSSAEALGLPVFVKPARAGSSVGVSKVSDWDELDAAMATALAEDDKVLVEAQVTGREIEVAILESADGPRASVPGEIVLSDREFYDFEGKYLEGAGVEVVCPADLSPEQVAEVQRIGLQAFEAVGCRGLARVDMFLTASGLVVNELNTMPGFTPISMFPKCWIASGMTYGELITELIDAGLRR